MGPSFRTSSTRRSLVEAAAGVMAQEGAAAVTAARVAQAAGVGRATVRRYFPDVADLVEAALELVDFPPITASDEPLEDRITAELERLVNELEQIETRRLLSILLERAERLRAAAELRDRIVATFVGNLDEALREAVDAGELPAAPDAEELFDELIGPLWSRRMIRGSAVPDEAVRRAVRAALERHRSAGAGAPD